MALTQQRPPMSLPVTMTVGARVRWLCKQRGWTLVTAADRSGVSVSTLSLLTRDLVRYPKTETIEKLANGFDVPRELLMPPALADHPNSQAIGEGVLLVPVVRLFAAPVGHQETGELIPVPLSVAGQHPGILATRITGGGLPPFVSIGALAIFDPDRDPRHRDPVVIDYLGSTHAAWYLEIQVGVELLTRYRLNDGTYLELPQARLAGVLLGAFTLAPPFNGTT